MNLIGRRRFIAKSRTKEGDDATICSDHAHLPRTVVARLLCGMLGAAIVSVVAAGGAAAQSEQPAAAGINESLTAAAAGAGCSRTSGSLALRVTTPRTVGISPLLVFFDATTTTDSSIAGRTTAFQDVTYTWNFGDNSASGVDPWAYGSNAGHNSRNTATGAVAAHMYVTPGVDMAYTVTVTARHAGNTASCQFEVSAYSPSQSHGFTGNNTTCVSSSSTPVAGSGMCPAGAAVLRTSSFNTALSSPHFGSGKRVMFKCGDTFSGDNATLSGKTWSVGAYGACQGTQNNRPIMRDSGSNGQFSVSGTAGDGRIADLEFEGNGSGAHAVASTQGGSAIPYQITLWNLYSTGNRSSYVWAQGAQWGLIESVMNGEGSIGTFVNYAENDQFQWSGNPFNTVQYQALLGNSFNGQGAPNSGAGVETVRISACHMCVISNNLFENANNVGAVLKIHNGNTYLSSPGWTGAYTDYLEISDNRFSGTSGAQLVENAPQNSGDDERLRDIVVERNLFSSSTGAHDGRQLLVSAVNETVRDNVFYMPGSPPAAFGVQVARRGIEPVPSGVEVYNNTCYAPNAAQNQVCVGFDGVNFAAPAIDSYAENNLFYIPAGGHTTVLNQGSGNTVGNNSTASATNPDFTDSSGSFSLISDFKPRANYSGATAVPVMFDAVGTPWGGNWELGALHP